MWKQQFIFVALMGPLSGLAENTQTQVSLNNSNAVFESLADSAIDLQTLNAVSSDSVSIPAIELFPGSQISIVDTLGLYCAGRLIGLNAEALFILESNSTNIRRIAKSDISMLVTLPRKYYTQSQIGQLGMGSMDYLFYANGNMVMGELLEVGDDYLHFRTQSDNQINNLPKYLVLKIIDSEGQSLYSNAAKNPTIPSFSTRTASTKLKPDQKILLVLESAEAMEVTFRSMHEDTLFYGDEPYRSVPLSRISSLWSEGLDQSATAFSSSCGLAGGLCVSINLLIIYIESVNDIGLISLAAVPIGAAVYGGRRAARKTTWQLVYRPTIPPGGFDYEQGRKRGKKLAQGKPTWLLPGFFYNFWAVQTSRNLVPCPPVSEMMNKSKPYIAGLIDGYSDQTSLYNTIYSSTGCVLGTGAAFFGIYAWGVGASHSN